MTVWGKQSSPRFDEQETPPLDLSGSETQEGLLARLQNQNSALEKLRMALDGEDDLRELASPSSQRLEPAKG